MTFGYDYSDQLREDLAKLQKKNKKLCEIALKKIEEIVSRDETTIGFYKNLKHDMSDCKRVHVGKSFILFFKVDKNQNFILFEKITHHDDAYK